MIFKDFLDIIYLYEQTKKIGPGIVDIAKTAAVSTATVDRVLNNRGGVKENTRQRVLDAAGKLGYISPTAADDSIKTKPIRLIFLLPTGTNPYIKHLAELIDVGDILPRTQNITCSCEFFEGFNAASLTAAVEKHTGKVDGIALMGIEHPLVREAVNNANRKGTKIVTIITDISNSSRVAFVGLDNRAAGRTAAHLLAGISNRSKGDIGLIAGSLSYLAHNEREMGFLSYMQENFPQLRVVEAREGHDDFTENYMLTKALIKQHPNLVGIYNIGGSSGGVASALREEECGSKLVFVGHGLGEDTRMMLLDGTMDIVIHQDPITLIQHTCHVFSNIALGIEPQAGIAKLSMQIICRENLP